MGKTSDKIPIIGGTEEQKRDYRFFERRLPSLLKNEMLVGKYLLISGQKERGVYDSAGSAFKDAVLRFEPGKFIIQKVMDYSKVVNFLSPAM